MVQGSRSSIECFRGMALEVYLLPRTPWEEVRTLQHRLVYDLGGQPRDRAALILCEHPPVITVGRQGSLRHIQAEEEDLRALEVAIRWTNRGGGGWLQMPGQLACYPIVPLDLAACGLDAYRQGLYRTLVDLLDEFRLPAQIDRSIGGVRSRDGQIAAVGIAVKDCVTYHGCILNVCVPMHLCEWVQWSPRALPAPVTCMFRELRSPVRLATVRETFARHFARVFGFTESYFFHRSPLRAPAPKVVNVAWESH